MNVHERSEVRELTAAELDEVTGGLLAAVNSIVEAIASVVNDAAALAATGQRLTKFIQCKL
jgi:hypothetical protein